jgi:hypothetical protein
LIHFYTFSLILTNFYSDFNKTSSSDGSLNPLCPEASDTRIEELLKRATDSLQKGAKADNDHLFSEAFRQYCGRSTPAGCDASAGRGTPAGRDTLSGCGTPVDLGSPAGRGPPGGTPDGCGPSASRGSPASGSPASGSPVSVQPNVLSSPQILRTRQHPSYSPRPGFSHFSFSIFSFSNPLFIVDSPVPKSSPIHAWS